jgi:hypothetical protein
MYKNYQKDKKQTECKSYINKIKNQYKKQFAEQYYDYMMGYSNIDPFEINNVSLSYIAKQSVRMQIDNFLD